MSLVAIKRAKLDLVVAPERARPASASSVLVDVLLLVLGFILLHVAVFALVAQTGVSWRVLTDDPVVFFRYMILGSPGGLDFIAYTALLFFSWCLAFLVGRGVYDLSHRACFGAAVIAYLFMRLFWGFLGDLEAVFDPTAVAQPFAAAQLYRSVWFKLLRDMLLPLLGLLAMFGGIPLLQSTTRGIGQRTVRILRHTRVWIRKSPLVDGMHGLWLFFVSLLAIALFSDLVNSAVRTVETKEELNVWVNMTPDLVILLSLTAGIGEEFLFRGLLLGFLLSVFRVDRFRGMGNLSLAGLAILLQAAFFGAVHSGYLTLAHMLIPMVFGLFMGLVALRFGIVPAMIVHTLIDVYAFAPDVVDELPWVDPLLSAIFYVSLVAPLYFFLYRFVMWWSVEGELAGRLAAS